MVTPPPFPPPMPPGSITEIDRAVDRCPQCGSTTKAAIRSECVSVRSAGGAVHPWHEWATVGFADKVQYPEPTCPRCGSGGRSLVGEECSGLNGLHAWHRWQSPPTKAIQKWADPAMVAAKPVDVDGGPRVYLLSMTPDPLGTIAATCRMYVGQVVTALSQVDDDERRYFLDQVLKTRLQAPFEFVKFHFMIEGVTRAFTHQMVRQRTAVYAQESLRFAVKEDMPTALPPSLAGTEHHGVTDRTEYGSAPQAQRDIWDDTVDAMRAGYLSLVDGGMPAEDARGLLPHATLTRLHYSTDLRALLDHAGNRLCTQAQFEWRLVFTRIAEAIRNYGKEFRRPDLPYATSLANAWQYEALSDLFRPVCYKTGKCEFNSDMDRACSIRDRVTDRAKHGGTDSTQWTKPFLYDDYGPDGRPITVTSPGIQPREWLADPTAARRG